MTVYRWIIILILALANCFPVVAQDTNPFSIIREASDTVVTQEEAPILQESTKLEGENPFTVSHIPIRKNQYKEIEQLAISNRNVQENISLGYLPLWVIISSMCLLAYLLFNKKDHLLTLIRSISNDNFMKMTNYEHDGGRSLPYAIGYLIFIINAALFIYLYITKALNYHSKYLFVVVLACCAAFFVGKHLVNAVTSNIFDFAKESRLYGFTAISFYNLLSVILLAMNIFLVFGNSSWVKPIATVTVFIFTIALLSRYYKGLRIGQNQLNSYFLHFFLYFCAFEITPWVILYKVVKDLI